MPAIIVLIPFIYLSGELPHWSESGGESESDDDATESGDY
jgi:hypothetical protein